MAARPRKRKLTVVKAFGTPASVVEVITEAAIEAQDDELLAIGVVKVLRGGEVVVHTAGDYEGFRHQLYAGAGYMQRHLEDGEE